MNDDDFDAKYGNMFSTEPTQKCPECGETAHAEWVDNGFGPYAVQAGPYHCEACGWVEGCPYKSPEKCSRCISFDTCNNPLTKKDIQEQIIDWETTLDAEKEELQDLRNEVKELDNVEEKQGNLKLQEVQLGAIKACEEKLSTLKGVI